MRTRNRVRLAAFGLWVALLGSSGFAQTPEEQEAERIRAVREEAARQAENSRLIEEARRQREEASKFMRADPSEIIASANKEVERHREDIHKEQRERFVKGMKAFLLAQQEFRDALAFKRKLTGPAGQMDKSIGRCLDLIRALGGTRSVLDPSEFSGYTATDIAWEAMATAERLTPRLKAVIEGDSRETVDIQFLSSLARTEADILRLQWLLKRLK